MSQGSSEGRRRPLHSHAHVLLFYSLLRREAKAGIVMKQILTHNPSRFLPLKRADPGNEFASEQKKIVI